MSVFKSTFVCFSVTRVESMCLNCLTTTLLVGCVCCSWSSLSASPYPGATVCTPSVLHVVSQKETVFSSCFFTIEQTKSSGLLCK